jgi:hypothetical protein
MRKYLVIKGPSSVETHVRIGLEKTLCAKNTCILRVDTASIDLLVHDCRDFFCMILLNVRELRDIGEKAEEQAAMARMRTADFIVDSDSDTRLRLRLIVCSLLVNLFLRLRCLFFYVSHNNNTLAYRPKPAYKLQDVVEGYILHVLLGDRGVSPSAGLQFSSHFHSQVF